MDIIWIWDWEMEQSRFTGTEKVWSGWVTSFCQNPVNLVNDCLWNKFMSGILSKKTHQVAKRPSLPTSLVSVSISLAKYSSRALPWPHASHDLFRESSICYGVARIRVSSVNGIAREDDMVDDWWSVYSVWTKSCGRELVSQASASEVGKLALSCDDASISCLQFSACV